MVIELRQQLKLSQQLVMTPQLQQAIKLLQLSRLELQDLVQQEILENPILEETAEMEEERLDPGEAEKPREQMEEVKPGEEKAGDIDWESYLDNFQLSSHYQGPSPATSADDLPSFDNKLTRRPSLVDHLMWQLQLSGVSREEEMVGALIIGNLNDDGYIKESLEGIAEKAKCSLEMVEEVLAGIQSFDPIGVAARDIRECLLLQASYYQMGPLVEGILSDHLGNLEKKRYQAIAKAMGCPLGEIFESVKMISRLEPKPGRSYSQEDIQYITPDVYVQKVGEEYIILLNEDGLPRLRISPLYRDVLYRGGSVTGFTKEYVQDKLRSAVWLIRSIHQRQRTIYKVTESIVKFQREFFDRGIGHLKPLILRDVAEDIDMHESTISRVTTNKYVNTPQGIFELKFFFNSSIQRTGGDQIASESVKNKIKQIIVSEDQKHPFSDQEIVAILRRAGIHIARRTVTKYREMLGILSSTKRKNVF